MFIVIVMLVEINEDRECIGKEAFDSMVHTEYVYDEEAAQGAGKAGLSGLAPPQGVHQ